MYLEGSDQHRGWFQSSLLVGLGTRGRPPFRDVLTHGFLIDVDGRKMSKSLGNTILPQEVIKESGAETLRLWVAMSDFREELRVGKQILQRVVEAYRKIRNTCRYLLANLYDFDPDRHLVDVAAMQEVDRYALARYADTAGEILDAYDRFDFPGDLPAHQPADDRRPVGVLRRRLQGSPVYVRRRIAGAALGAERDVSDRRRAGAPAGAHPAGHRRRDVAAPAGTARRIGPPRRVPAARLGRGARRRRAGGALAAVDRRSRRREPGAGIGAPGQDDRQLARCARRPDRGRGDRRAARPLSRRPADAVHRLAGLAADAVAAKIRWRSTSAAPKATSAPAAGGLSTRCRRATIPTGCATGASTRSGGRRRHERSARRHRSGGIAAAGCAAGTGGVAIRAAMRGRSRSSPSSPCSPSIS